MEDKKCFLPWFQRIYNVGLTVLFIHYFLAKEDREINLTLLRLYFSVT